MVKFLLITLAIIVVGFVVVAALQPGEYRITRSAMVAAPPAAVFAQVNDLRNFQTWSPFAKLDPKAKNTFSGPPAGKDASLSWAGNSHVGEGSMTITESRPNDLIRFRLDFVKPFAGTANSEFTFVPEGDQTRVTWTMTGEHNFVGKAVGVFMNMDKMMGGHFEKGLADLGAAAQAGASK